MKPPPSARGIVYDVAVDEAGLGFEPAGPLFERYTVGLMGRVDRRWVECYRKATADSSAYSGFRLEPGVPNVSFVCRSSDGPIAVMTLMKKLQELVDRANKCSTTAASLEAKAAHEESEDEPRTGFFSRITRSRST